jgi:type II secretory ATPase GspE/PulE/Tfp pilus assembly ATPase PilB-like protein
VIHVCHAFAAWQTRAEQSFEGVDGVTLRDLSSASIIDVATVPLEPEALHKIPRALALGRDILSVATDGNQLTVVVPERHEPDTVEKIRYTTGMHVTAIEAPRSAIRARLHRVYQEPAAQPASTEPPATAAANEIMAEAVRVGASDVHIEPTSTDGRVRIRVDGILQIARTLDRELYVHVVSRLKFLAGMDIADRRQPQDGRYNAEIAGRTFEARVSSVPTTEGEKLAIRLLADHASTPEIDHLDIPAPYDASLRQAARAPHGFIVVAGPTGSGKTTTLYALMNQRDPVAENLCSVEDPVEVRLPGVSQLQVNARAGVTFASALRAFLRQDPNVIMVGEMRDRETAAVAASAALSGQLVLTSLHSNDAVSAVERLMELGVHRRTVSSGLTAVLAQRLVRKLCEMCRVPVAVSVAEAREFQIAEGTAVFAPAGCERCNGAGFAGRLALFELLIAGDAFREALSAGSAMVTLKALARQTGCRPMLEHGVQRAIAGQTSLGELRRVLAH